jgi:hypothetical protein
MLEVLGLSSLPGGPAFLIPTRQTHLLYSQAGDHERASL